jgi:prolyl-tRNA editing enzyme YbaK/EbsC (Cys-tRNA(Pro) deacylase)
LEERAERLETIIVSGGKIGLQIELKTPYLKEATNAITKPIVY